MTTTAPGSTAESRAAAFAMFEGQAPCSLQLADPPCPETARWLAWFAHEENTVRCAWGEPMLLCHGHKTLMQSASHPFWRTWHQMQPIPCGLCGTPLRIERFEPL